MFQRLSRGACGTTGRVRPLDVSTTHTDCITIGYADLSPTTRHDCPTIALEARAEVPIGACSAREATAVRRSTR